MFPAPPVERIYEAVGLTRRVRVDGVGMVTVVVRLHRWWSMGARRREDRPRQVSFPIWAISSGWLRPALWWLPGVLYLNVPAQNNPWGRRTNRMRKKGTYPRPRPHRILFRRKQQPWFVYLAEEIGIDGSSASRTLTKD